MDQYNITDLKVVGGRYEFYSCLQCWSQLKSEDFEVDLGRGRTFALAEAQSHSHAGLCTSTIEATSHKRH